MTALLTRPLAAVTLSLIDTVEFAAGRALSAGAVTAIAGIVRDTRPAIPRTVWVAEQLVPTRARPTDETMALAVEVIAAVRAHDYRVLRGELAA
jgi:hypothetical protein